VVNCPIKEGYVKGFCVREYGDIDVGDARH